MATGYVALPEPVGIARIERIGGNPRQVCGGLGDEGLLSAVGEIAAPRRPLTEETSRATPRWPPLL